MPQVHNKTLSMSMDSSAFSKNSRLMAAYNFTEQSMRRVKVQNGLDKRLCSTKLKFFEKEGRINDRKIERVKARLVDNLHKRLAYKLVLRKHPIAHAPDYKKALDGKYSYKALYNEVKEMVHYITPEFARERRAKALIDVSRKRYDHLIRENRAALDVLCPPKPRWQAVDFSKFGKKDGEDEEEDKQPSPELPAIEKRNNVALKGLRRRIITLDDSKPNSPIKSPTKAPPLSKPPSSNSLMGGKRQGITMSMMKKQTSFLSNKEKTQTLDTFEIDAKQTEEAKVDTDTGRTIKTGRKSIDLNKNDLTGSINDNHSQSNKTTPPNLTDNKLNKQSILPPIKQQARQSPGIQANDISTMSPTLHTGTPVKLPVLKMNTNNAGKEIRVH